MGLLTSGTVLEMDGIDLGSYSCRGLSLQLAPIDSGPLIRDVNGTLHDLTIEQMRKYALTISCQDVNAPQLTDVWKGKEVTVTLIPNTGLGTDSEGNQRELDCLLSSWQTTVDEWGAKTGWSMTLLQV